MGQQIFSLFWQVAFIGFPDRAIKGNGSLWVQNRDDSAVLSSASVLDRQVCGESRKGGGLNQCGKGFVLLLKNKVDLRHFRIYKFSPDTNILDQKHRFPSQVIQINAICPV